MKKTIEQSRLKYYWQPTICLSPQELETIIKYKIYAQSHDKILLQDCHIGSTDKIVPQNTQVDGPHPRYRQYWPIISALLMDQSTSHDASM